MNKITIIPNREKDIGLIYTNKLKKRLYHHGCHVCIDEYDIGGNSADIATSSLIVVIGGDGSILRAARRVAPLGIPILGINMGRLGYMAEMEVNELDLIERLFTGEYHIEERMMLSVEILYDHAVHGPTMAALNDAVISNGVVSKIVEIELYCSGNLVGHYRADGLITATPTGSTAYSLSAGGPVIDPRLDCMCVTPVSPHSLRVRPMIFSADSILEIRDTMKTKGETYLTVDGSENHRLEPGTVVRITRSQATTKLLRLKKYGFYDTLNNKMSE